MTWSGEYTRSDCADSHLFSQQAGGYDGQGDGCARLQSQDACWMDEEDEDHVLQGEEEGQGEVWAAPPILTSRQ